MIKKLFSFFMVLTMLLPFSSNLVLATENPSDSGWEYKVNIKDSDDYYYFFVVLKATKEIKDTTIVGYLNCDIGASAIPKHIEGARFNNHMSLDGYHFDHTNLSVAHIESASAGDDLYFLLLAPKDAKKVTLNLAINGQKLDIKDMIAKDKAGEKVNVSDLGTIENLQTIDLDLSSSQHFNDKEVAKTPKEEDFEQKDVKKTSAKVENKKLVDNQTLYLVGGVAGVAILLIVIGTFIYIKKAN